MEAAQFGHLRDSHFSVNSQDRACASDAQGSQVRRRRLAMMGEGAFQVAQRYPEPHGHLLHRKFRFRTVLLDERTDIRVARAASTAGA
ncbi:hypothetical protein MHN80_11475 [Gordonia McavH-238-E]|nr:hypothetical protein [Gordonia sp. McavH-238-E]MCG7632932.1 hypothetical protein [Gordonia sp. McavH-238-E]